MGMFFPSAMPAGWVSRTSYWRVFRELYAGARDGRPMHDPNPRSCFLVLGMTMPCVAWSETIAELVSREDGVDFGRCELTPRPHLRGAVVHAVIPAWFEKPGIWSTRSLLLVGVDDSGTVQQQRKLRLGASVPPREVVSINCSGSRLDVRLSRQASGRTLAHRWTGTQLTLIRSTRQ